MPEPRKRAPRKKKLEPKYPDLVPGLNRLSDEGWDTPSDFNHVTEQQQHSTYFEVLSEMLAATK